MSDEDQIKTPEELMSPQTLEAFERGNELRSNMQSITKDIESFVAYMCEYYPSHTDQIRKSLEGAAQDLLIQRDSDAARKRKPSSPSSV